MTVSELGLVIEQCEDVGHDLGVIRGTIDTMSVEGAQLWKVVDRCVAEVAALQQRLESSVIAKLGPGF